MWGYLLTNFADIAISPGFSVSQQVTQGSARSYFIFAQSPKLKDAMMKAEVLTPTAELQAEPGMTSKPGRRPVWASYSPSSFYRVLWPEANCSFTWNPYKTNV